MNRSRRPRVVVIGGGFGGLEAVKGLRRVACEVLLVDRANHHLFQPLLYQVASAALSPGDIARPLREILRRQRNVTVLMDEVRGIDPERSRLRLRDGEALDYDYAVIAVGTRHSYFGKEEWERPAPGLKTLGDALDIRSRIFRSFERAEAAAGPSGSSPSPELRFVVVGGGPTGVEMAGAIAEIAHQTMLEDFRHIDPTLSEVLLVEVGPRVLPAFPEGLGERAQRQLEGLGVRVLVGTRVGHIDGEGVTLIRGGEEEAGSEQPVESRLGTSNVVWAAGNEAPGWLADLEATRDRQGRVCVAGDLSVPGRPEIFVIGDAAHAIGPSGEALPGVAPVAVQQGRFVARLLCRKLAGRTDGRERRTFVYRDRGTMATIGKARAVAWMGRLHLSGWLAWLAWSGVHILFLIGYRNRLRVALEWLYWYFTSQRSARLLYDTRADSPGEEAGPD